MLLQISHLVWPLWTVLKLARIAVIKPANVAAVKLANIDVLKLVDNANLQYYSKFPLPNTR